MTAIVLIVLYVTNVISCNTRFWTCKKFYHHRQQSNNIREEGVDEEWWDFCCCNLELITKNDIWHVINWADRSDISCLSSSLISVVRRGDKRTEVGDEATGQLQWGCWAVSAWLSLTPAYHHHHLPHTSHLTPHTSLHLSPHNLSLNNCSSFIFNYSFLPADYFLRK